MCFLFDCCIFIVRFASLRCYSSGKTRIQPVISYQINKSFCSITHCASLHLVYHLIAISTRFRCPELQLFLFSSPCCFFLSPNLNPKLHLNCILNFSIAFSHHISVRDITVLTLQTCKSMQVPFNVGEFLQVLNKFVQPYYSPTAVS